MSSIIGFQYIKYAQQDLQEVPKEPHLILGEFLGCYALEQRQLPMLETAAKYYTKTADLIRNQKDLQSDSRSALYN